MGIWGSNVSFEVVGATATTTITGTTLTTLITPAVDASVEFDLYASYSNEVEGFGYEIGYIAYRYPNATAANFEEIYVAGSYSGFSLAYYAGQDDAADNIEVSYGASFGGIDTSLTIGDYEDSNKYYDLGFGKSYAGLDYSLNIIKINYDNEDANDDTNTVFSISKSF